MLTSSDIKRALRDAGLEIYRTEGDTVSLADRVRENLILDSGVRITTSPLAVSFVVEAPRSQFPGEEGARLFDRARGLGRDALEHGFNEAQSRVAPVEDPNDPARVLDERYQVVFRREVASVEEAIEAALFAMSLSRCAER